jgi:hypothetical protein
MSAVAFDIVCHWMASAAFVSCDCRAAKNATLQSQEIDEKRLRFGVLL